MVASLVDLVNVARDSIIGPDDNLIQAGLTSLEAVRLAGDAWRRFGWNVTAGQLLRLGSLRRVAEHLAGDRMESSVIINGEAPQSGMSLAQRAMLAMSYMDPGSPKMNVVMRWQLDGVVDERRLRTAISTVVAYHPVLRTLYRASGGAVILESHDDHSLTVITSEEGEGRVSRNQFMEMPFDLDRTPPVRWLLDYSGPASACFYAVLHHVSVDDAALATLHRALVDSYAGLLASTDASVSAVGYSAAFAAERRLLEGRRQADLAFWRGRHGSFDDALGFSSSDRPPGMVATGRRAVFSAGGATSLERAARLTGVTAYSLFLAVSSIVVARALGGDAVLVGMPVSSRAAVGGDGLLGCFANLVPLVIRDYGGDGIRSIREANSAVLLGLDHGLLPFAEIARLAGLPSNSYGVNSPSFVCQLEATPQPVTVLDLTFTPTVEQAVRAFYSVTIRGETSHGDLAVCIDYDPGAIDDDLADHLLQELLANLAHLCGSS
jgi:mycobactin peptide synthetase MbtE